MDLPRYPTTAPVETSVESRAPRSAGVLLVLETVLLLCSLPVQLLMMLSLGWEGGDEALKHRLIDLLPALGLGGLMAAVLSGVAASTVWRSPDESVALTGVTAVLVVALAAGWVAALRGDVLDAAFGSIWLAMTAPAPAALAMLLVVRRRVRRESGSPPR